MGRQRRGCIDQFLKPVLNRPCASSLVILRAGNSMANPVSGDEYMRLLYAQAAREQRELAERVRAAHGSGTLAADFERWATDLERPSQERSAA
jgi:hypothetical protein